MTAHLEVLFLAFFAFLMLTLIAGIVQAVRCLLQDRAHRFDGGGGAVDDMEGPAPVRPFDHAGCERTYIDLAKESR